MAINWTSMQPTSAATHTITVLNCVGTGFLNVTNVQMYANSDPTHPVNVPYAVFSDTSMTVSTPNVTVPGIWSVQLIQDASTKYGRGVEFVDVLPAPTIASINPPAGGPGTFIAILGTNLSYNPSVTVGGIPAQVQSRADNQIQITAPSGLMGPQPIVVTTTYGTATAPTQFAYPLAPTIASISPTAGTPNTLITVVGTYLANQPSATVGGIPAPVQSRSDTQLLVTAPSGLTGPQSVKVTTAYGTATSPTQFTYPLPPTITNVSPPSGAEGTRINLTGTNLDSVTSVVIAKLNCTILSRNATQIAVNAPTGPAKIYDSQPVVVTNPAGSATASFSYPPPPPPVPTSQRQAWLTLAGKTLYLDDHDAGYACLSLDVGYPDIRDVVNNRPDSDGIDDRTKYFGARVVSANITAWPGGSQTIDDIAALFAPYMQPNVRAQLHWKEWSTKRLGERLLTVRPSAFASPMPSPFTREIQLQWVAADPTILDGTINQCIAWAGSPTGAGRTYNLTYYRLYPAGSTPALPGSFISKGDVGVYPWFRLYGPITAAYFYIAPSLGGSQAGILFRPSYSIPAGHFVEVSSKDRTALYDGDPGQPVNDQIDWTQSIWPYITPNVQYNLYVQGSSTSGVTQVICYWRDGYLT